MFETLNLDGLSINPKDLREASRVLAILSRYAKQKAFAMDARLAGNIQGAIRLEAALETLYGQLPQWAKW